MTGHPHFTLKDYGFSSDSSLDKWYSTWGTRTLGGTQYKSGGT
jgi:hypothetical protein